MTKQNNSNKNQLDPTINRAIMLYIKVLHDLENRSTQKPPDQPEDTTLTATIPDDWLHKYDNLSSEKALQSFDCIGLGVSPNLLNILSTILSTENPSSIISACRKAIPDIPEEESRQYYLTKLDALSTKPNLILTADLSDVENRDLFRRIIMIFEQKNRVKDTLPLNSTALSTLTERYKAKSGKTEYVFYSLDETELDGSNVRRGFLQAMKRAQVVDFRFLDLRHTFAIRLVQAGVDLYKVQRLMRHKSPQMTQRYAHHYPESLRDGVEVLDMLNQKRAQFRHSQADKKNTGQATGT